MKPNLKRRASSNGKDMYRYSILSETAKGPCSLNTWQSFVADIIFAGSFPRVSAATQAEREARRAALLQRARHKQVLVDSLCIAEPLLAMTLSAYCLHNRQHSQKRSACMLILNNVRFLLVLLNVLVGKFKATPHSAAGRAPDQ